MKSTTRPRQQKTPIHRRPSDIQEMYSKSGFKASTAAHPCKRRPRVVNQAGSQRTEAMCGRPQIPTSKGLADVARNEPELQKRSTLQKPPRCQFVPVVIRPGIRQARTERASPTQTKQFVDRRCPESRISSIPSPKHCVCEEAPKMSIRSRGHTSWDLPGRDRKDITHSDQTRLVTDTESRKQNLIDSTPETTAPVKPPEPTRKAKTKVVFTSQGTTKSSRPSSVARLTRAGRSPVRRELCRCWVEMRTERDHHVARDYRE